MSAQTGEKRATVQTADEASRLYLRGQITLEQYEEFLNDFLPSRDTLVRSLSTGLMSRFTRWLSGSRPHPSSVPTQAERNPIEV